jgi:hypothetical protein
MELRISECPEWLAQADEFYETCKLNARSFDATFYPSGLGSGEHEHHGVWFATAPENSHFVMGCSIGNKGNLMFLGIYYTAEPSAIAVANTSPIVGADFDGNVVLKVGRYPVTFTAVRMFVTEKIRPYRGIGHKESFNCNNPLGENGYYYSTSDPVRVNFSNFDSSSIIFISSFNGKDSPFEFVEFFKKGDDHQIIFHESSVILIDSSGSIFVNKEWLKTRCRPEHAARIIQSPMLFHQMCRLGGYVKSPNIP